MIGKSYFLLSLLQVGLSQEWKGDAPREVTAQEGVCVQIPCHYTYPSHLANQPRVGIWFNNKKQSSSSIAFHSEDHNQEAPQFRHRTRLSGDLKDGDCSLIINSVTRGDAGPYYFRIEFDGRNRYNYHPVTQLQVSVGLSQEWKRNTPRKVTAQEGSCVQIPCHYSYPSHLEKQTRDGVWFYAEKQIPWAPLAFHSKDHNHELQQFRHRTRLSGDLKDGDCSLIINNVTRGDAGPYFFRIEFDTGPSHNYYPVTRLRVSDFTDKPTIFPAEIIAGKRVNISCTFNTTCNGTAPVLTWDTPTDVPGSVSNTVTQHGVTLTYTSVLTLIPSLKHHGHNLTCRVRSPSVSLERTLILTVQYAPQNLSMTFPDTINPLSINLIEGSSTVIICSVESFPASNLMWRHLNVPINSTRSNNELWLVIPHVTSWHTGDYQCVAENEHGAVEGSITITVEHQNFNQWITGLLGAGITLCVGLIGFIIYKCVRKGSCTGRGHSAQAEQKRGDGKQETKLNSRIDECRGPFYENCEVTGALRNQKKKDVEMKPTHRVNSYQVDDVYANCDTDKNSIYANK
ncbi:sialic acid-binding Ig-like lectin 13 [Mustelus asterias]